jgi:hypothetical protein
MTNEKLIGWLLTLAFIGLGFGATALDWQTLLDEGSYHPKMAFFGPLMGFIGLAMLAGPPALPEGMRESLAAAQRRKLRQRLAVALLVLGLIAGAGNLALMEQWINSLVQ